MIYTVFPTETTGGLPQDFETYEDALEYANENYYSDEFVIESTTGSVV